MAIEETVLGQVHPVLADTPVEIVGPPPGETHIVRSLSISNTNTGGQASRFSIYMDVDGTTYDETTSLAFDVEIATTQSFSLSVYWPIPAGASLAIETSTADNITATAFGIIVT